MSINPLVILVGFLLVVAGRKLYWLLIGAGGFLLGVSLVQRYFGDQSEVLLLVAGLLIGLVLAMLAVVVQRISFGLAGALAGVYLANWLLAQSGLTGGAAELTALVIGGIIGAVLALMLLDWALIVLSALLGAGLLVRALDLQETTLALATAGLFIAGVAIQAGFLNRHR